MEPLIRGFQDPGESQHAVTSGKEFIWNDLVDTSCKWAWEIGFVKVASWDIYCILVLVSHTPFWTSAGVVAGCASLASRSCPETVDAGLSTGLTASSVSFFESGCALHFFLALLPDL